MVLDFGAGIAMLVAPTSAPGMKQTAASRETTRRI
jgi:hypothetical protein